MPFDFAGWRSLMLSSLISSCEGADPIDGPNLVSSDRLLEEDFDAMIRDIEADIEAAKNRRESRSI